MRFTLPRDLYFGSGSIAELKTLKGHKAIVVTGGHSMKASGFLDKTVKALEEAGTEYLVVAIGKEEINFLTSLSREQLKDFSFENDESKGFAQEQFQDRHIN